MGRIRAGKAKIRVVLLAACSVLAVFSASLEAAGFDDAGEGRRPGEGYSPWEKLSRSGDEDAPRRGSAGLRLSLRREGGKRRTAESLRSSLERDGLRVGGIRARALRAAQAKASSRSRFRAAFPDLVHPGGRREPPPPPPLADGASNASATPGVYKFVTTVESGVPLGSGEYFTDLYVGTPPQHFSVIMDTGSDLTWVQCDPCRLCYAQKGLMFRPNASSSYEGLRCSSESCKSAGGFGDEGSSCENGAEDPGVCRYFYTYGDASNTTGDYALETVTFNVTRGDPLHIEQILFGCGHSNVGLFQGSGGLLGLGQGPISFISQVGNLFKNKFSYCLLNRDDPYNLGSPLIFGEDEVYSRLQPRFQWTPFLEDTPIDSFYFVNITGVSVGGEVLKIPHTAWEIDMDGYGGTIIDSGTTLSYFRQEAFDVIQKAFEDRISYPKATDIPVLNLCYNLSDIEDPDFPAFSITFKGNAVMELPLKNYFIRPDPDQWIYCLAMLGVPSKNLNIMGNFQQQNFHVVYDREHKRLGFAPVDCSGIL